MDVRGQAVPPLMYGTAWKEERTQACVEAALEAGFRAIDTANQRKHYFEAGVGAALKASGIARDQLFLQTKYTFQPGQDHRLPYDPDAPIATQVGQSVASSLEHLGVAHLDSYVLHGPMSRMGFGRLDWEAWRAMEAEVDAGRVTLLGVSNVSAGQLRELCEGARIVPAFVQNRCYAARHWDADVRAVAAQHDVVYQGFSLLTANDHVVRHPGVGRLAQQLDCTPQQLIFAFALHVGMLPLTGTTDPVHMRQDLAAVDIQLSDDLARALGA